MIESNETIFISIGGSIIHPDTSLNAPFLSDFNRFIRKQLAETNRRFFVMVGGGHIGREYQYAGRLIVGDMSADDLDWMGIHGTRMNAHLVRTVLRDVSYSRVVSEYEKPPKIGMERVIVCSGWKPGWSTDYDMVLLGKKMNIKQGICLINVRKIYEKDPAIFPQAKSFEHITWKNYRDMIGNWWSPLRQLPFDPFAAKMAQETDFTAYFVYGKNIENVERLMSGKAFEGTVVSNKQI